MNDSLTAFASDNHMNKTGACVPITLSRGGTIVFNSSFSLTLPQNVIFEPACNGSPHAVPINPPTVLNEQEPFYASTFPQMYAIAAATVISYLLLIMLFITPRTYFIGGRGGAFLSRHGMIGGSYGSSSVIGIGGRPWLQKVAVLTVVISLSIATADSFTVAKRQYDMGFMDSMALTDEVVNGVEIRAIRVISSTFLWLAQVQTLIRLFPRHKEKVIIKWVGFAMIVLDTIFSILNNTVRQASSMIVRPRHIVDAIPALNYLFELSLSLLYAAWVIFYSISKHRFAFFHRNMRNICLVALLSLIAILIPVVFFILDVSKPNVAGWGEYIRWVGAAAASVVVWEWVERIEALEREERKDGILGREIFDGDEMLDETPSEGGDGTHTRLKGGKGGNGGNGGILSKFFAFSRKPLQNKVTFEVKPHTRRKSRQRKTKNEAISQPTQLEQPAPVPQTTTPVSRADTISTVYRVRHHSVGSASPSNSDIEINESGEKGIELVRTKDSDAKNGLGIASPIPHIKQGITWLQTFNPFSRRRGSPPQEVASAQAEEGNIRHSTPAHKNGSPFKSHIDTVRSLLNRREDRSEQPQTEPTLPVTVIPVRSRQEPRISRAARASESSKAKGGGHDNGVAETPLPVVVIPARPRVARQWDSSAFEEYLHSRPGQCSPPQHGSSQLSPGSTHSPSLEERERISSQEAPELPSSAFIPTPGTVSKADSGAENSTRFPGSRSSSGKTLTNSMSLDSKIATGRIQSPPHGQGSSSGSSDRRTEDPGGTGPGVT